MDTAEALSLHSHRLGAFAEKILEDEELVNLLQTPDIYSIVLIPSELGIKALDKATMHEHTHDPRDYVVIASERFCPFGKTVRSVSERELTFKKETFKHLCNSVQLKNDRVEGPIETPNGRVYLLDRPLQFYE